MALGDERQDYLTGDPNIANLWTALQKATDLTCDLKSLILLNFRRNLLRAYFVFSILDALAKKTKGYFSFEIRI